MFEISNTAEFLSLSKCISNEKNSVQTLQFYGIDNRIVNTKDSVLYCFISHHIFSVKDWENPDEKDGSRRKKYGFCMS